MHDEHDDGKRDQGDVLASPNTVVVLALQREVDAHAAGAVLERLADEDGEELGGGAPVGTGSRVREARRADGGSGKVWRWLRLRGTAYG